jgi:hypothetical protein
MRSLKAGPFLILVLCVPFFGAGAFALEGKASPTISPLDVRIGRFDVSDVIVRDALSELSLKNVDGLHLGFEEIIREKIQDDPETIGPGGTCCAASSDASDEVTQPGTNPPIFQFETL